jgi:hypothetical protein
MALGNNLLKAAKQIALYLFITVGIYIAGFVAYIVLGFLLEKVLPNMGLNASGTAYSSISTMITAGNTAVTAILAIVTIITGLLTLNVVLTTFGVKLNFNMGGRV